MLDVRGQSVTVAPGEDVSVALDGHGPRIGGEPPNPVGTLRADGNFVSLLGATYVGASVLVNKALPGTIDALGVHSLVDFDAIVRGGATPS